MINTKLPVYLASKSPRRKKLLKQLNISFKVVNINLHEKINNGEKPIRVVKRLANDKLLKAREAVKKGIIITADTIVVINGKILGKPKDQKDAVRILKLLSGKAHAVYTGFAIYNSESGITITDYEKTIVKFRKLSHSEIIDYIKTGSPMDKAGAYGIQDDFGAVFVQKISGCYYNVMGLPLTKVYINLLKVLR